MERLAGVLVVITVLACGDRLCSAPTTRQVSAMDVTPLRRLAQEGDNAGRTELARRLLLGRGVNIDAKLAVELLAKAVDASDPAAMYELALCYRFGLGVKVDDARAQALMDQSAGAGFVPAEVERLTRALATPQVARAASTRPSTRPDDASSPAVRLLALARRGEPSALVSAARWAQGDGRHATGATRADAGEPLGWLLKAASSDDDRSALVAVRLIAEGDGPLRPDRSRAVTLYRRLAERGLHEAHVQLAALAPESYAGLARSVSAARLFDDPELIGVAVELEGDLTAVTDEILTMRVPGDPRLLDVRRVRAKKPAEPVKPSRSDAKSPDGGALDDAEPSPGRIARVAGLVEAPGKVLGLMVIVPEPRYQLRFSVQPPQVVRSGKTRRFIVEGEFKNVARQRIQKVKLKIRLWQPDTPNDETEILELDSLQPGETRKFAQEFDLHDYRDRASTERPTCEVKVESLDW